MNKLYSEMGEQAIIGSCLMDKEIIPEVLSDVNANDFYDPRNCNIFKAIKALHEKDTVADIVTVCDYLRNNELLDSIIGGSAYVASFVSGATNSQNVEYYIKIIKEKAILRGLRKLFNELNNRIDSCIDTEEFLNEIEKRIMAIELNKNKAETESVTDISKRTMKIIEERATRKAKLIGLPTGIRDLDRMTLGFRNKQLIIIGGRPSQGKSSLGINIASYLAIYQNIPTAFFSLEDNKERIVTRIFASHSRTNSRKVSLGAMNEDEWMAVTKTIMKLTDKPLYLDDASKMTIYQLNHMARKLKKTKDIKILFVDYLQLITGDINAGREREISSITHALKALAKELDIPIVAMAQLNRNVIYRKARPKLSDFRESGAIEQDADIAILLHRPNKEESEGNEFEVIELVVAKQKDGPIGKVSVMFHKEYLKFDNYNKEL